MKKIIALLLIVSFWACKESIYKPIDETTSKSKLIEIFRASNSNYPNISAHRGGKGLKNYPENCLETIRYVNDSISAIFEVDVAQTKDGTLILMHDNSVERTTNGKGLVKNLIYRELRSYNLVDDYGNETKFKIPLFSEVLKWSKANSVILTVDIKQSVNLRDVIKAIEAENAKDICIIITYDLEQAQAVYNLAPDLLLSVSARNHKEFDGLLESNIPTENMLAFTGTRLSDDSLYERIHTENVVCILGTLGNLDKRAEAKGNNLYKQWQKNGADILATDRPFEAFKAINN